ncbi:S8 family serine peptidase [Leucobacter chromiiresistens]|uniref:S8 family serine peptidase n=1 Tax=Leucobacter chromiiresistens TaxID=1079994 RepID=UPI000734C213|nr:S8 family serine peptidase [Leucobacter chromiiresistens]
MTAQPNARRARRTRRARRRVSTLVLASAIAAGALVTTPDLIAPVRAVAAEECGVGVMARLPGPPSAFAAMGWAPQGTAGTGATAPTGAGITVAIVDSGVDVSRPQLAAAFAPGSTSLISDGERPDGLGDPQGHGTALAGIIAARPSETSGVVGIAPDARIVSLRTFRGTDEESTRAGYGPDAERLAKAIRSATDLGAQIIVVALSDDVDTPALRDATADAAARGSLVVASGGNRGTTENTDDTPRYPAAYPGALAVTAVDPTGLPTADSIHGPHIEVAAPGQDVLTTSTGGGDCRYAPDAPSSSFATAYAAGAAALLAERYPDEGPDGWAYRLQATASRSNPDARDDQVGWGVIRPAEALDLRPDSTTRGPTSPFADTSDAAFATSSTRVTPHPAEPGNAAFVTAIAVVAAGLVSLFGLGAILRRRR